MAASEPRDNCVAINVQPIPSKSHALRSVSINSSPTLRSSPKPRASRGTPECRLSGSAASSPNSMEMAHALSCSSARRGDGGHHDGRRGFLKVKEEFELGSFSLEGRLSSSLSQDEHAELHEVDEAKPGTIEERQRDIDFDHHQAAKDTSSSESRLLWSTSSDPLTASLDSEAPLALEIAHLDLDMHPEEFETDNAVRSHTWCGRLQYCKIVVFSSLALLVLTGLGLAAVFIGPILLKNVILPMIEWEELHLSKPLVAVVGVASMALLPVVVLPTGPSMWLLGITFNYSWAFCFIMLGAFFGQSLPYAFGHWLMHDRVQRWLSGNARLMAILRLADSGGWFQQFKATLFLRMSPLPYNLFNYAITATGIKYGPYICASMVAMIPETFIAIYCGRLIQKLALAHSDPMKRPISPVEVAYEVIGLCAAGSVVVVGMIHGHRAFKELEAQEKAEREGQELVVKVTERSGAGNAGAAKSLSDPALGCESEGSRRILAAPDKSTLGSLNSTESGSFISALGWVPRKHSPLSATRASLGHARTAEMFSTGTDVACQTGENMPILERLKHLAAPKYSVGTPEAVKLVP